MDGTHPHYHSYDNTNAGHTIHGIVPITATWLRTSKSASGQPAHDGAGPGAVADDLARCELCRTDVAIEAADIVLVGSNPYDVRVIVNLARTIYGKMIQNRQSIDG